MVQIFRVSYAVFKDAANIATVYYHVNPKDDGYVLGTGNDKIVYSTKIKEAADIADFALTLEPSAILVGIEEDVLASPTIAQTGILQFEYDLTGASFLYIGKAKPGVLPSVAGWTIQRFAIDSDGNVLDKKRTFQDTAIWDNRVIETYF